MAVLMVLVVVVAPLALVVGIPYYFSAKEIHHALVDKAPVSPCLERDRSCTGAPAKAASGIQSPLPGRPMCGITNDRHYYSEK